MVARTAFVVVVSLERLSARIAILSLKVHVNRALEEAFNDMKATDQ
jgi:hypothetical protein